MVLGEQFHESKDPTEETSIHLTELLIEHAQVVRENELLREICCCNMDGSTMSLLSPRATHRTQRISQSISTLTFGQRQEMAEMLRRSELLKRSELELLRHELDSKACLLESADSRLWAMELKLQESEELLSGVTNENERRKVENELLMQALEKDATNKLETTSLLPSPRDVQLERESEIDCFCNYKSQTQALTGLDNTSAAMQLTLVQDELEFTKMKLAKEIEMSINGMLERREVRPSSTCVHQCSFFRQATDRKKLKLYRIRAHNCLLIASVIHKWSELSAKRRTVELVLRSISRGSCNTRVKQVLQRVATMTCVSLNTGMGHLEVIAAAFLLFAFRNNQQLFQVFAAWNSVLDERRLNDRNRTSFKSISAARHLIFRCKSVIHSWMLFSNRQKRKSMIFTFMLLHSQHLMSQKAWNQWRKYTVAESRNFKIGVRTYEKYLLRLTRITFLHWGLYYDQRIHICSFSKQHCRKWHFELQLWVVSTWRLCREQSQSASSPALANTRSLHYACAENDRGCRNCQWVPVQTHEPALATQDIPCDPASDPRVASVLPRRNLRIFRESHNFTALQDSHNIEFSPHHEVLCSPHNQKLTSSILDYDDSKFLFLTKCEKESDFSILAGDSRFDAGPSCGAMCQEMVFLPYRFRALQSGFRSWNSVVIQSRHFYRKNILFRNKFRSTLTKKLLQLWVSGLRRKRVLEFKALTLTSHLSKKLVAIHMEKWLEWIRQSHYLRSKIFTKLPCIEQSLLVFRGEACFQNGDEIFLKNALDRIDESICSRNLLKNESEASIYVILGIERAGIGNVDVLKQDLCRFVAESCNLQCEGVTVTDIRGGKWTVVLLNVVGLHLSNTDVNEALMNASLSFSKNDFIFRHLKIRCIGRVPAMTATCADSRITVDPIRNGHTFIVAHIRSAKGQLGPDDLAEILFIYFDELRTSVRVSEDHVLDKVKTITIRTINKRVHRYLLKLQYYIFTSWTAELRSKYVRHFAKFLEGLKSRAYGAWHDKVLNYSWYIWKQRIATSRSKWSRRLPTRSCAATDFRKDPASFQRINFFTEAVGLMPLQILQKTQNSSLTPAAVWPVHGHNAFRVDSALYENAFPKKLLIAAKSFNAWRSYVTCHEPPANGVKALVKRCTTGCIQDTLSKWRRYWWLQDALKRKEIVLSTRYLMFFLKAPFETWLLNSKLQQKFNKVLYSIRFTVLDQMFSLWLQHLHSWKALVCTSTHKLRGTSTKNILRLCVSAWIGHAVTLKLLKLTSLTICRRQCRSIMLVYPGSWHVPITAVQYKAVILFAVHWLQKQCFITWRAKSASLILLQKSQHIYLSNVRSQVFSAWSSLLSAKTVFLPNQCTQQLYFRKQKQGIIRFLELQQSRNLRYFIFIWSQASYLLKMKKFMQNHSTHDVNRIYCWKALAFWKQFCAERVLLVKQQCIDLLKNGLKCFFTWKVAAVHQRAHRDFLTETINWTHLQYLRTAFNHFVVLLERKKRVRLLCDRATCFAQVHQKQNMLGVFLNIKKNHLTMKYPASILLLKSFCSQEVDLPNSRHFSLRSAIVLVTDIFFRILQYRLANPCGSIFSYSAVGVVFIEWKFLAKMRIQRQNISCHLVKKKVEIIEISRAFSKWRLFFGERISLTQHLSIFARQQEYAIKLEAVQRFFVASGLFVLTSKSLVQPMLCWTRLWKKMRSRPSSRGLFCTIIKQSRKKMLSSWTSFLRIRGDRNHLRCFWCTWKKYLSKRDYIAIVHRFTSRQRAWRELAAVMHGWKASSWMSLMSFQFLQNKSVKSFDLSCRNFIKMFIRKLKYITMIANLQRHVKVMRIKELDKLQDSGADVLSCCFSTWNVRTLASAEKDKNLTWSLPVFQLHDRLSLCVILAWRFQARSNRLLVVSGIRVIFFRKQNLCRLGMRMLRSAVISRKFMMSLSFRLIKMRQRCLLSEVLDRWYDFLKPVFVDNKASKCDFLDKGHSNSHFISGCSRAEFPRNDPSFNVAQNAMKHVDPCNLNHESPDLINDWNGYIKALKARDMIIEMQQNETVRLTALLQEKATAMYQREQSIAIRDKWLEQLSIESQMKDSVFSKR